MTFKASYDHLNYLNTIIYLFKIHLRLIFTNKTLYTFQKSVYLDAWEQYNEALKFYEKEKNAEPGKPFDDTQIGNLLQFENIDKYFNEEDASTVQQSNGDYTFFFSKILLLFKLGVNLLHL